MILREREGEIIDANIIKQALFSFKVVTFRNPDIEWDYATGLKWKDSPTPTYEDGPGENLRT